MTFDTETLVTTARQIIRTMDTGFDPAKLDWYQQRNDAVKSIPDDKDIEARLLLLMQPIMLIGLMGNPQAAILSAWCSGVLFGMEVSDHLAEINSLDKMYSEKVQ